MMGSGDVVVQTPEVLTWLWPAIGGWERGLRSIKDRIVHQKVCCGGEISNGSEGHVLRIPPA